MSEKPAVTRDPGVMGGKTVLAGTRIPLIFVHDIYLRDGLQAVYDAYPHIAEHRFIRALEWAMTNPREVIREREEYDAQFKGAPLDSATGGTHDAD